MKKHNYHLINPSPLPIATAFVLFFGALGGVSYMHNWTFGTEKLIAGIMLIISMMIFWWRDVIKEAIIDKAHTQVVQNGLRMGMACFILTEVMFFVAFFISFFKAWLAPLPILDGVWPIKPGIWPPEGIKTLDPWEIPFINTLILLLSGTTITWAHYALLENNRKDLIRGLLSTIILGLTFTTLQILEYSHAPFSFKEIGNKSIYTSNFFMATGFHGAHVIVGTTFLIICLFRAIKGHFSKEAHLGLEFAAWYWHFVDVVWLFLFTFVYFASSS